MKNAMNIVLLESLGISDEKLQELVTPLLKAGHSFQSYSRTDDLEKQKEQAKDADILIIANMPLKGEVIRACEHLKFIDVAFTGVDHVDLDAAREKNIRVSNAAGYSTQAVAELALCMMLSLLRNVPKVSERCRSGMTKDGLVGSELSGKTVGIVGAGAIGSRVAALCHAFGCRVLGNKRHVTGNEPSFIEFVLLDELLKNSDIVSLHCPLTADTRDLIDSEKLSIMKKGAYLINTSRGPVVNTSALVEALHSGHLAGAGIDVFETEPPLPEKHPLLAEPNVLVTPHVAFASHESMEKRAEIVFANVHYWLEGKQQNIIL